MNTSRTIRRGTRAIRCAVVGASGYAGAELVERLALHPDAEIVAVQADASAGRRWEDLHPRAGHLFSGLLAPSDPAGLEGLDAVFLARPSGESARMARALVGRVGTVIDLSGDFRLPDEASYREWYGIDHPAPELLGSAAYGLPEIFGESLRGAQLVACAGCYATVAQLAAAPALDHSGRPGYPHEEPPNPSPGSRGMAMSGGADGVPAIASSHGHGIRRDVSAAERSQLERTEDRFKSRADAWPRGIVVSAVSGTTGAGRKADVALSFSEVSESVRAYRVGRHQHAPEIAFGLQRATGREVPVTFVPHLAPLRRGIFATVVLENEARLGSGELLALYRDAYAGRPFVRVVDPADRLPSTSDVAETNFCDLSPVVDESAGTIVVLGVLDNLVKGAAGQAVQVLNCVFGLPEETGLLPEPKEVLGHA